MAAPAPDPRYPPPPDGGACPNCGDDLVDVHRYYKSLLSLKDERITELTYHASELTESLRVERLKHDGTKKQLVFEENEHEVKNRRLNWSNKHRKNMAKELAEAARELKQEREMSEFWMEEATEPGHGQDGKAKQKGKKTGKKDGIKDGKNDDGAQQPAKKKRKHLQMA